MEVTYITVSEAFGDENDWMDNSTSVNVSPEEMKRSIDQKDAFVLLDVRTPQEYAKYRIEDSVNLPLDHLEDEILNIIQNKDTLIYVYCLSGSRSVLAVDILKKLGYKRVYNLANGLLNWRSKNFPLVTS